MPREVSSSGYNTEGNKYTSYSDGAYRYTNTNSGTISVILVFEIFHLRIISSISAFQTAKSMAVTSMTDATMVFTKPQIAEAETLGFTKTLLVKEPIIPGLETAVAKNDHHNSIESNIFENVSTYIFHNFF